MYGVHATVHSSHLPLQHPFGAPTTPEIRASRRFSPPAAGRFNSGSAGPSAHWHRGTGHPLRAPDDMCVRPILQEVRGGHPWLTSH
ncbi:hypothetical protein CURTO8I2_180167 [Curtobacterium sp. 8I-2]|nr:hypothetical protein CURTO8I2_180167 [Curtobacterium sp. 8I-2]